jgi:hypothetical protein
MSPEVERLPATKFQKMIGHKVVRQSFAGVGHRSSGFNLYTEPCLADNL